MDIANASMLDESTAAAEAMTLIRRSTKHAASAFFVDAETHPQTIAVVAARAEPIGIELVVGDLADLDPSAVFGALLQHPGTTGRRARPLPHHRRRPRRRRARRPSPPTSSRARSSTPPGEQGADVCVGSSQRFGVPLGYGGPHAGFLATRDGLRRSMPGRLVGVSVDAAGRPAHRLALQTREQHIRREKATSNICTAQVLLAVIASMYAVYHGPEGLRHIAETRARPDRSPRPRSLRAGGVAVLHDAFFDTLAGARARSCRRRGRRRPRAPREPAPDRRRHRRASPSTRPPPTTCSARVADAFGVGARRRRRRRHPGAARAHLATYLTHPVFSTHRSETELLRYLRRLADMDIALDRSMIPLGSCTMKLNATTEMAAVTWPELGQLHPFCPPEQAEGYRELITSPRGVARGDHRLRPRLAPAQRRLAGRAGRAPRHPRLPRVARRARPRRVPHPELGPRHQRRVGGDGRHAGGRGGVRRRRQRRPRRPRAPRSRSTPPTSPR